LLPPLASSSSWDHQTRALAVDPDPQPLEYATSRRNAITNQLNNPRERKERTEVHQCPAGYDNGINYNTKNKIQPLLWTPDTKNQGT
jgi:hypothetical protein